jgi:hypothetical protein
MTETTAKSGAAGASTDTPDSGSRSETSTDAAAAASSPTGDRSPESTAGPSPLESPTNLIRTGSGDEKPGSSPTPTSPSPAVTSAGTYTPRVASSTPPPVVAPISTGSGTPAGGSSAARLSDAEPTVRTSASVPIVGVPSVAGPPTKVATAKVAPAKAAPAGSSTGRLGTTTGTPSGGSPTVGAVTGRASVVTPAKTTVTGTGLRQTTGSTSVVGMPARPGAAAVGAARVSDTLRSARATVTGAATRGPRRARLHLKRIDPWSVMKFSFAVSLVLFVVAIVATSVLYLALDAMNVFDSINTAFAEITGQTGTGFKITAKGVIGTAVLLGAVNMVLFTALATLGAFVYNVCADLVGGVELTLSEKE